MSDVVVTEKGTTLPLLNLKGKKYLMVAYRLQWLSEKYENYTIDTEFPILSDEQTVAKATVTLFDKEGKVIRRAMATKRETKKDFPDHAEKAETAAIGRALSMLGLGTQHAISDLDEGNRLADSPLDSTPKKRELVKPEAVEKVEVPELVVESEAKEDAPKKASSFRKAKKEVTPEEESEWG